MVARLLFPDARRLSLSFRFRFSGCGGNWAGLFAQDRRIENLPGPLSRLTAERTGASVLALDSPGCMLQIRGGLEQRGSPIQVKHIAQLLAEEL